MNYNHLKGFWNISLIEKMLIEMSIGEELTFTLDHPEDIEINREPSGWYGIRKDIMFDSDVLMIGYYGGDITRLYNVDFAANISDFGTVGDCIRDYIKKVLDAPKEMLYVEYDKKENKKSY